MILLNDQMMFEALKSNRLLMKKQKRFETYKWIQMGFNQGLSGSRSELKFSVLQTTFRIIKTA